jgi:hypothetical protein
MAVNKVSKHTFSETPMKIASAELQMASSHSSLQHREISESLKMWVGPQRPDFENRANLPSPPSRENVILSDAGKAAAASVNTDEAVDEAIENDPRTMFIRMMIEMLTGKPARIFNSQELTGEGANVTAPTTPSNGANSAPAKPAGFGIEYDYRESYTEIEASHFSTSGIVKTGDGREISFDLQLSMSRQYYEESSVSLRLGDAARKVDPLVLNFSGNAASLTNQRFSFDLDADGTEEQIARLSSGSAYLVFDRNKDGKINDGSEMFGPTSGDGFAELAALDDDKNGWIDENDSAFNKLSLWQQGDDTAGTLRSLGDTGVGALALANISTPFDLKNPQNELLGQIRTSGIFLHENGKAGTIQQIDLTV